MHFLLYYNVITILELLTNPPKIGYPITIKEQIQLTQLQVAGNCQFFIIIAYKLLHLVRSL